MNEDHELIAKFVRKYPELLLVEPSERGKVLEFARPRLMLWLGNACALLLTIPLMIGTTVFTVAYKYLPTNLPLAISVVTGFPVFWLNGLFHLRIFPRWRSRMWAAMIDHGVPVCLKCSEDLGAWGQREGDVPVRCPRCDSLLPTRVIDLMLGSNSGPFETVRLLDEARLHDVDDAAVLAYAKTGEQAINAGVAWKEHCEQRRGVYFMVAFAVFIVLAVVAAVGVAIGSLLGWLQPPLIDWIVKAVLASIFLAAVVSIPFGLRTKGHFFRAYFTARGVPLCRKCSHDFRGIRAQPVPGTPCPRCGEPLGDPTVAPKPSPSLTLDAHERPIYGDT